MLVAEWKQVPVFQVNIGRVSQLTKVHNEVDTLQAVELSASIDKHLPRSGSDRWITLLCCLHLPLWPYGLEWESSYRV